MRAADGYYDVRYNDGSGWVEPSVDSSRVRLARGGPAPAPAPAPALVQERQRQPGVVSSAPAPPGAGSSSTAGEGDPKAERAYAVGERVEVRYRGNARYYPGRIFRVRRDRLYDIDYDDGDKETRVSAELIRSLESGGGGRDSRRAAGPSAARVAPARAAGSDPAAGVAAVDARAAAAPAEPVMEKIARQTRHGRALGPGARVTLVGLVAEPRRNGAAGTVEVWDARQARWEVRLDGGDSFALREDNLRLARGGGASAADTHPIVKNHAVLVAALRL